MTPPGSSSDSRRARAAHPDEETRYRAVAGLDPADPLDREVLLARLADPSWRVRSAAVERFGAGPPAPVLRELAAVLADGPGVGAREAAAAALARLGAPAVPVLVERLAADDPDLRQAAAGVLGAVGDPRAVAPLTARLADRDPNVRAAAAEALGRIGGPDAVAALRAGVDSDDANLRLAAVEALASLGACVAPERVEALLGDRLLRRAVYRMLGACDDAPALAIVARGAADPSRPAREAALGALGHQRARRDAAELAPVVAGLRAAAERDPGLADAWAAALGSEDAFALVGALTALAAAGAVRHAGQMVRLAQDERYRALVEEALEQLPGGPELRGVLADALPGLGQLARLTALSTLARLGSPAAFESLVREASDPASYVQAEAVAAIGRMRDVRGVAPLAGLLGDEDPVTAGHAAAALARIGQAGPQEREAVLAAVRARCEASPSQALYRAVGAIGGAEDLPFALGGLRAARAVDRAAAAGAVRALAQRGLVGAGTGPALVAALSDPAAPVRVSAARALGELARTRGGPTDRAAFVASAAPALAGALSDPDAAVRAAAADALGACGRADDAGRLAEVALDPAAPPVVIVAALHALVAVGPVPAAALARALGHPDAEVVKEAVLVAARVPGAEGERALREAAASPRWDVRRTAARAMAQRGDRALRADAERLSAADPDPLVARAFAEAARALGGGSA
jgi:HEAT repeat protein